MLARLRRCCSSGWRLQPGVADGVETLVCDGTTLRRSVLPWQVRDRWSIEHSWRWPRDIQLREDAHRTRETNGVPILATLRSLAMNALRLDVSGPSRKDWPLSSTTSEAYWLCWAGRDQDRNLLDDF